MLNLKFKLIAILILTVACAPKKKSNTDNSQKNNEIICDDFSCQGSYVGKEFINGSDIAHQFSNKMSAKVGDKLKELYAKNNYSKVDFNNIKMATDGMGSGNVKYELIIPFVQVKSKCQSFTSFDHVGGWNHAPELENRKKQLQKALLPGDKLDISQLKKTKEGLEEYWIQWRNRNTQADCKNTKLTK